ncbi:Chaperone protein dnaJ 20 [Tripterygium wilfordii]|uniref:Chaperone protein dnaJ 20 n=1 Tax=Tripterygium wilfordii TaxID=458696 RepID=A0A7J7E1Q0_TRIWF|nr:chaperone protein dnaJ 20, chloroplastic-like [Tripterygium wilfordii]KAF5752525.1 Chaperone protein dnaJ 20 [Tripterygium wilfordii]
MRCYGLVIPGGSDASCFTHARRPTSDPVLRIIYPARIQFASFKAKATIREATKKDASFYELLGIPETGTLPEIKQAYKQLARKYHPDVSPPDRVEEYTRRFIMVQEAYETLSDSRRRALYDRDMARGIHLAFSARRGFQSDLEMEERSEWKNRWEAQLSDLKRRSMTKDARGNLSWGAQMRRQRDELSSE